MPDKSDSLFQENEDKTLLNRIRELEDAIRKHMSQKLDDRCWLDDAELYKVIGGPNPEECALPPEDVFLANCKRYHQSRQPNNLPYAPVHTRKIEYGRLLTE